MYIINIQRLDSFQPRTVCVMPMFHAFVNVAVLPTLRAGGQVITLPKFEPFSYVEALERYKVRILIFFAGYTFNVKVI